MSHLRLVPLLAGSVALCLSPAPALASCNGATGVHATALCPPSAAITATPPQAEPLQDITFSSATSTAVAPAAIVTREWDLDNDGSYEAGGMTATRSFPSSGNWTVRLRVVDDAGGSDTSTLTVHISRPPVADLVATDYDPLSQTDVTLDASGSHDALHDGDADPLTPDVPEGPIAEYAFDVDGNGSYELAGAAATRVVQWPTPGSRQVGVRVTDSDGVTATDTITVDVANRLPVASLALPSAAVAGHPASVSGLGSSDDDGVIAHYRWDLDGVPGYEVDGGATPSLTRTWPTAGPVTVGLEVTDDFGDVDTTTISFQVVAAPSAALLATPQDVLPGEVVTLDAAGSSDPDSGALAYTWDLDGDGVFETSTGAVATATTSFPAAGSPRVYVRVTDPDGLTSTASATVTVRSPDGSTPDPVAPGDPGPGAPGPTPPPSGPAPGTPAPAGGQSPKPATTGTTATDAGPGAAPGAFAAPRGGLPGTAARPRGTLPALDSKVIQSLRSILKSGVRLACRAAAQTRCTVRIELDRATARKLKLRGAVATTSTNGRATGAVSVVLSAKARTALRSQRSVRLYVKGTAAAKDGSRTPLSRVIVARR